MTSAIPYWPRGMSDALAAAYVGLSKSGFLSDPTIPGPVWIKKGRRVWLREDLDAWLDGKAGKGQAGDQSSASLSEALKEWHP